MSILSSAPTIDSVKSYTDFSGLAQLKRKSSSNDPETLKTVAKQFESIFINMMLKSMRQANEVFNKDSFLDSQQTSFYQDMFDQQISLNLSEGKRFGLADIIVKQLSH